MLLPLLARHNFDGLVIETDLARAMIERAAVMRARSPALEVMLLRADALDLPLRDRTVDVALSVNGLHVMPDTGPSSVSSRGCCGRGPPCSS